MTEVFRDANKGPVVELTTPAPLQLFQGPAATIPIRFKASDPDGFIKKVEVFDEKKSLGEPTLRSDGEYKLQAVATDADGAVGKSALIEVIIDRR
jgi:hypothetical protein